MRPMPESTPPTIMHASFTAAGFHGLALYGLAMGNCCELLVRLMEEGTLTDARPASVPDPGYDQPPKERAVS
jgi:hypothetical protein